MVIALTFMTECQALIILGSQIFSRPALVFADKLCCEELYDNVNMGLECICMLFFCTLKNYFVSHISLTGWKFYKDDNILRYNCNDPYRK